MSKVFLSYVPHGSNPKYFFPIYEGHPEWEDFVKFRKNFYTDNQCNFVVFWNNRNIRRKQPGDVILGYKRFCDRLPKDAAKKCVLLMKTQVRDPNGTDLIEVKNALCPDYKVLFNEESLPTKFLNFFYNLADVTVSMSSAEGFGLSINESIMAGTVVTAPVTGGLQDQMRFEDNDGKLYYPTKEVPSNHRKTYTKCGSWAYPIFPRTRALQGSIPTPYIFDDISDAQDLADNLYDIYNTPLDERNRRGLEGREWVLSQESGMSTPEMAKRFIKAIDHIIENREIKKQFTLEKFEPFKKIEDCIVW